MTKQYQTLVASSHQRSFYVSVMEDKQNKQTYRYTKQLVRIALDQGYTPAEILVKAGLSENSTAQFSRWRNGKALAKVRQLQYFINQYEHLLKRKIEHLFYSISDNALSFRKLHGEVVLKHVVRHQPAQVGKRVVPVALLRMILLKEGNKYHLVHQVRAGLTEDGNFNPARNLNELIHSSNEDANWSSYKYQTELSAEEALESADDFIHQLISGENVAKTMFKNEGIALSFIIRQALLKQGHQCKYIVDLADCRT